MTVTCVRDDCTGTIDDDGFCDECGHRHDGPPTSSDVRVPAAPATLAGSDGALCARAGCGGRLVDGYCDECGLAPSARGVSVVVPPTGAPAPGPATAGPSVRVDTGTRTWAPRGGSDGAARSAPTAGGERGNLGAGLVEVPVLPAIDPLSAVVADPEVPERKRSCAACGEPVGRTRGDVPGRTEGFCTHCGAPFSFTPKLARGDLVAGQYQVEGCIAHGGMGWVYLARDRNVSDKWVVLKGLLDSEDAAARSAAEAERRFLAEIEHPNIVKIFNFVQHGGAGYIVMEYVGGPSLREIRNRHLEETGSPLPVAQAIAYILELLPAFGFLHRRGFLYCDFKPDNAIQVEEQLKLIDLGGVRTVDDDESDLYGTIGYQAPEVPEHGASVASDLYTVGRTLAVLAIELPGYQDPRRYAESLPPASEVPAFQRYESFHQFLVKATAPDPSARFTSAADMAAQLRGVLRQVVALDGGSPPSEPSRLFSAELGQGPAEDGWRHLPVPTVDPTDPAAAVLASMAGSTPAQAVALLEAAPPSPERSYQLARALLDAADPEAAARELDAPEAQAGGWRAAWWRGVLHLAAGRPDDAVPFLSAVAAELPGELAPRLALAVAFECAVAAAPDPARALAEADRHYGLVAATDPTYAGACMGLSRTRAALGDRATALAALQRVPSSSSSYDRARVSAVRLCAAPVGGSAPPVASLVEGSAILARLELPPSARLPLARDLLAAALDEVADGRMAPDPTVVVVGSPLVEDDLRRALESTHRSLATLADTAEDRRRQVDLANAVRPRTRT